MKISDEFMVMRRTADLTQVGLARMLDVSQQTICNWEVGHTTIPAWAWIKVQELSKQQSVVKF